MYLKYNLSVQPSNSLYSVIYQDQSSFQVYMELFHFPPVCMNLTSELKKLAAKKVDTGIMKKSKEFQYWGQKLFLTKKHGFNLLHVLTHPYMQS